MVRSVGVLVVVMAIGVGALVARGGDPPRREWPARQSQIDALELYRIQVQAITQQRAELDKQAERIRLNNEATVAEILSDCPGIPHGVLPRWDTSVPGKPVWYVDAAMIAAVRSQ